MGNFTILCSVKLPEMFKISDVFRTISNIMDKAFLHKKLPAKTDNYFHKKAQ